MNTRRATPTLTTLLITAITAITVIAAIGATARAGLSTESPFAPRGQTIGPVTSNTPIELRGIISDEQGPRFAIYDPVKKDGTWVGLDEKGRAFTVRSYDEATNRVVVDYQGKAQTIALVEPKFGPGKAVAGGVAMPGVIAQPGVANIAQPFQNRFVRPGQDQTQQRAQQQGADEAKRLEAIRAEVARRRAQREASAQQGQQQQGQPQQR